MADDYIGIKVPVEMRARILAICAQHGITVSEWIRLLIANALDGGDGVIEECMQQTRGLALNIAIGALRDAQNNIPSTVAEAMARYGDSG